MLADPYAAIHEKLADAIQSIADAVELRQIPSNASHLLVIARLLTDAQLKLVDLSLCARQLAPPPAELAGATERLDDT